MWTKTSLSLTAIFYFVYLAKNTYIVIGLLNPVLSGEELNFPVVPLLAW